MDGQIDEQIVDQKINQTVEKSVVTQEKEMEHELMKILGVALQENETFDAAREIRLVAFICSGIPFGIFADEVYEILRTKELVIHKVPRTRVGIMGMINLRGDILPVVNFRDRFNQEHPNLLESSSDKETNKFNRLVIVKAKGIQFGLLVEQVIGMVCIDKESMDSEYVSMIAYSADFEGKPIRILKLDELF